MSKLSKKQSMDDLLRGMTQEEAKKLRNKNLVQLIIGTPALILGISYGGNIILGLLLGFVVNSSKPGYSLYRLIFVPGLLLVSCGWAVGGIYAIKKTFNLYKIQRHLNKMKPPLDELLPDMSQAETKKLRNKDLVKLILITPALILGIAFCSGPVAGIIEGLLGGIYIITSAALSFAFTENTDSLPIGSLLSRLFYILWALFLIVGFVAVGIYAVRKVRNLHKIQRHLSSLNRT